MAYYAYTLYQPAPTCRQRQTQCAYKPDRRRSTTTVGLVSPDSIVSRIVLHASLNMFALGNTLIEVGWTQ
jgi:20S proteasome alpha/beta subunit